MSGSEKAKPGCEKAKPGCEKAKGDSEMAMPGSEKAMPGGNDYESFFDQNPAPGDYPRLVELLEDFCLLQATSCRPLVLVTSGGTTIPLELNTVRFVDNFSSGARGSASAEYFLKQGWAVVFLYRAGSLQPFARHVNPASLLETMQEKDDMLLLSPGPETDRLRAMVREAGRAAGRLLQIPFTSLSSYLWLLRAASLAISTRGAGGVEGAGGDKGAGGDEGAGGVEGAGVEAGGVEGAGVRPLLYLAAAVSDFYIPASQLPVHKIQSSQGPPVIQLQCVPKMLEPLMNSWVRGRAGVVTFKLETDPGLLLEKARKALDRYGHRLVIGNLLDTRKREVLLVYQDRTEEVRLSESEMAAGGEIEERIVGKLLEDRDYL